jgi:regulator of sigma E protease
MVRLDPGEPMTIVVNRAGKLTTLTATPTLISQPDRFGNVHQYGQLGIGHNGVEYVRRDPLTAVAQAFSETWSLSASTVQAMWQIAIGVRSSDELGGPLRIAQMSGEVVQTGLVPLLWFMSVLSINLGLINLFPVPVLDGGHLLFYAAEAIRGKPLGHRAQEYGFRIGLALVLTLMVYATWNDLFHH